MTIEDMPDDSAVPQPVSAAKAAKATKPVKASKPPAAPKAAKAAKPMKAVKPTAAPKAAKPVAVENPATEVVVADPSPKKQDKKDKKDKKKAKRKDKKNKEAVIIRFDDAQLPLIDGRAEALGLSRAAWVRMVVAQALAKG